MAGSYPHNDDYDSEYQKILRKLQDDGYLVESRQQNRRAA
jgi:hypothetical protein